MHATDPVSLFIVAAAAWYLAFVISSTAGPLHMFERLRERLPLGGLTQCVFCLIVWIAGGLWFLYATPLRPIVEVLAVAGAALMLAAWTGAKHAND